MLKKAAFLLALLFVVAAFLFKQLMTTHINAPLILKQDTLLEIPSGQSFNQFSKLLVTKGWLENRFWLRNYVRIYPELSNLKAGTYLVKQDTSLLQLLTLLVAGNEHQFQITFIEGSTFKEWLAILKQHQNIQHTLTDVEISQIAKKLNITQANPEGLFFPDTYAFTDKTTDLSILKRAHLRMKQALENAWRERQQGLPYTNSYQALIMASIIEKESGKHDEQPMISSVFVNRLRKKMRLQTDPTVIYGLGDRYQGDIKYKHLREKTAYNTYRINGLPPTPIAMPGLKAIQAAMQPAQSNYLYFVSNGNGQHVFSTNLADHNKAVKAYLLIQKQKNL